MPVARRTVQAIVAALLAWPAAVTPVQGVAPDPDRKIIVFGYDTQMPEEIAQRMALYEASPLQGMVLGATVPDRRIVAPGRGTNRVDWLTWGAELAEQEIAASAAALAARPDSNRFTELFMRFNVTPGWVDWFDDQAWERLVTGNWRLIGRLVREGRLRGILLDTEIYAGYAPVFSHAFAGQGGSHSWPRCVDKAFQRGQEAVRAVNAEVSDLDIMVTFGHGYVLSALERGGYRSLQDLDYGLIPAFLDGMLSAKAPDTRIIDGWEGAYRYKEREQFAEAYRIIHEKAAAISLVPEIYRSSIMASFGIWICDPKERWDPERPYYTPQEFAAALRHGLEFSDRYVWVYHERIQPWALRAEQVRFPEPYWQAIREAAAPFAVVKPSRPLSARPAAAPLVPPAEPPRPCRILGAWSLRESLDSVLEGGAALEAPPGSGARFEPTGPDEEPALYFGGGTGTVSLNADRLPAGLGADLTWRVAVFPTVADAGHAYPILSALIPGAGAGGLGFEVAAVGTGAEFHLEVTQYDAATGVATGWQATPHDYALYAPYSIAVRYERGGFAGLFVNDHQAIFGLWKLPGPIRQRPPRRFGAQGVCLGLDAAATGEGTACFAGFMRDLRLYDGALSRPELASLALQLPRWRVAHSPGLVLLDFTEPAESRQWATDKWPVPAATPFMLKSDDGSAPAFVDVDGARGVQLRPQWKSYLEASGSGPDSQPLDRFLATLTFRLDSMPPAGAAYGLFGRGDGTNANTSFGVYVGHDGTVYAHAKSTANFAKSIASAPAQVESGRRYALGFALDRPDGTLMLSLDGLTIASGPIGHPGAGPQSLRFRPAPLRIGRVLVEAASNAPFEPRPAACYFDGVISEFRLERQPGRP